jgi:hypothetical protein
MSLTQNSKTFSDSITLMLAPAILGHSAHAVKSDGRSLILGVARTGAKFTNHNHRATGDAVSDLIQKGFLIPVLQREIAAELRALKVMDVKYIHEHARNPDTGEQSADLDLYRRLGKMAREIDPDALISFGASRNGPEIAKAIEARGEIARTEQARLPLTDGGAHFVTSQAAIELQIVTDMERQGFVRINPEAGTFDILRDLGDYVPSGTNESVALEVHSTAGGGNYGPSSAKAQIDTLQWSIAARKDQKLPFEVEWVQTARSAFLTYYLANVVPWGVRNLGRMNITLLFGFSPWLPFPETYGAFRTVVEAARNIAPEISGMVPLRVSVTVGAAVLPKYALQNVRRMDVGTFAGQFLGPMERLIHYASQPDSGVDVVRVGMEDAPYLVDLSGRVVPATNLLLVERARAHLESARASLVTDPAELARFWAV